MRGLIALAEQGRLHQGVSGLSDEARASHSWKDVGSNNPGLIEVLKSSPHPVPKARDGGGKSHHALLDELRKCTPRNPCIIGWVWSGGGGHWTICAGPTKDNTRLVLLDPWDGLEYLPNEVTSFYLERPGRWTSAIPF